MWRSERDESNFSDSELLAWEFVLPYMHIPILDADKADVQKVKRFLDETFPEQVLADAVKNLQLRNKKNIQRKPFNNRT